MFGKLFSFDLKNNDKHKVFKFLGIKLTIKKKVVLPSEIIEINKKIKKAKYVHIMRNQKFNKPFVDFLNRNFNQKDHVILCIRHHKEFPFPEGDNVIEIKTLEHLKFSKQTKIICHSLFDAELVNFLYNRKKLLQKQTYWVIWGADLYNAQRNIKNDYVRSHFKGYITTCDVDETIKKYGTNKNFYSAECIFPINIEIIKKAEIKPHDYIQIQINNSCDESIFEILNILEKFKNENIKISAILSYGNMEIRDEIISKGKEIFGDKFEPVLEYMSPTDYVQHLAENDILIMNQKRQQGFGNIIASMALGKKVFLRSDVSTFGYYTKEGLRFYDTKLLPNLLYDEFINDNYAQENEKKIEETLFNEIYMKHQWEKVFNAN